MNDFIVLYDLCETLRETLSDIAGRVRVRAQDEPLSALILVQGDEVALRHRLPVVRFSEPACVYFEVQPVFDHDMEQLPPLLLEFQKIVFYAVLTHISRRVGDVRHRRYPGKARDFA